MRRIRPCRAGKSPVQRTRKKARAGVYVQLQPPPPHVAVIDLQNLTDPADVNDDGPSALKSSQGPHRRPEATVHSQTPFRTGLSFSERPSVRAACPPPL